MMSPCLCLILLLTWPIRGFIIWLGVLINLFQEKKKATRTFLGYRVSLKAAGKLEVRRIRTQIVQEKENL